MRPGVPAVVLLLSATATATACAGGGDSGPGAPLDPNLLDLAAWTRVSEGDDPLAAHRPDPVDCDGAAFFLEAGQLEVRTDRCNYASVDVPLAQSVPAGTPVRATLFHTGLWAPEPAQAHVALLIGDDHVLLWETTVAIPEPETTFFVEEVPLPIAVAAGEPLHLHLHNHGDNAWVLAELVRTDAE